MLGGRMNADRTVFAGPYVATDFPDVEAGLMPLYAVVVGRNAPLYREPRITSGLIGRLSYDIVDYSLAREGWVEVRLRDERHGFMRESEVRSPVDARATFAKVGGQWRLTEFIRDWD
jgi:hypothetical protein